MRSVQITLFLTVFLYLLGFGVMIPLVPHMGRDLGASSTEAGLLMATYSLMQFLFAPFWGRLSDRLGRRRVLLTCLGLEIFTYAAFFWVRDLTSLFVLRALTGFFGASLSTANAAMADATDSQNRSKGMALIGAAFGLGFVIGPAIGGGLSLMAETLSSAPHFKTGFVGLSVSFLFLLTFIFAYFKFPETLKKENRQTEDKSKFLVIVEKFKNPSLRAPMVAFFLLTFSMACMESTLVYFMADRFQWTLKETSFGFAFIGIVMVFTQGFLVRKLLPRWGELKVLLIFIPLFCLGMLVIAPAMSLTLLALSMTLIAIGIGHANPSLNGTISLLSNEKEQGATLGVTQSLSSLGRIVGPGLGGWLYGFNPGAPFYFATSLGLGAWWLVWAHRKSLPSTAKGSK
jgi:DHA1 family tetracycline resistance protein-like MFS transporter